MNKKCVIIGGGTTERVSNHFSLSAPAYGKTAKLLQKAYEAHPDAKLDTVLCLTKMAGNYNQYNHKKLDSVNDIDNLVDELIADPSVKMVFFSVAMCDFAPEEALVGEGENMELKKTPYSGRLNSRDKTTLFLRPNEKVIQKIRKERKDIFLVGFKATSGDNPQQQYLKALNLCKNSSCNLVFANDETTGNNMIVTPEEAAYHESENRDEVLTNLVDMAILRSHLMFTRSTVIAGEPIEWNSDLVPKTLREVVNHCIEAGAYKEFNGSTVGHFAAKLDDTTFLTSKRKTNFNDIEENGLVKIKTDGPDSVTAYGAKPSVGGQSQRIIFQQNPEYDSIVHFHCPIKSSSSVPIRSQREFECGSHECGQNTADGLKDFGNFSAVHLDKHGPNIVFDSKKATASELTEFINSNWELSKKTGGYMVGTWMSHY